MRPYNDLQLAPLIDRVPIFINVSLSSGILRQSLIILFNQNVLINYPDPLCKVTIDFIINQIILVK